MTYAIIIITLLALFIFTNYNGRIRRLEREIAELKRKINEDVFYKRPDTVRQPPETAETTAIQETPVSSSPGPADDKQHPKQDEDRLSPAFEFLKQNALTIIGIFTLVLGIGYFVKYALDKNWIGETSRVGIGVLAGTGIIGLGHFLRKNYAVFASIITGGGIAVLYFTITIAFREYHLFSQMSAFGIICFITLICILISSFYNSETLNVFSLSGGFLAPLMISSGENNYLFLFSYLTILNIGMLAIAFLKNWKRAGWISFLFTTVYLAYWTAEHAEMRSVYFYIITYLVFYLFALRDYNKNNLLLPYDILMLVLINFTSITGLVYLFETLRYEPVVIFPVIFALVNLSLLYREYARRKFEIPYSVFAGIAVSLFTAAVALQFKTHLITSLWAIESTLMLFIWKRTQLNIFKRCFYILFPLVIMAQLITWTGYIDTKNLAVVFNPVFLTSAVTVTATFVNLILLRKLEDFKDEKTGLFKNMFAVVSYGVIYIALLLEIVYHLSEKPWIVIFSTAMLYSLFFIFIILLFRRKLELNKILEVILLYIFFVLIIINTLISGSGIISDCLSGKLPFAYYPAYLLYWIPFAVIMASLLAKSDFFKIKLSYWAVLLTFTVAVSGELYHIYIMSRAGHFSDMAPLTKHFSLLYLPIIWAVLASLFLYKGLKSGTAEYNKAGFVLISLMIFKLYAYDVWEMDNVSRIIAFIMLGIILLLSSFLFQRVKKIIRNMVERKEENTDPGNTFP
ncbi:DUF2339 domain-containing protein [Chryseobacterium hagamense]|uniref:Membrane protein n=1 Tax=Chryseobacterium hagamense TaxID=395935 RepID=A0A511YNG3_9FLAO|nr:DUF2339 domain-containing protein [Chryseobacterium hagamense]GEN76739.1 membrane protein [Chryseobacterium hagamense]